MLAPWHTRSGTLVLFVLTSSLNRHSTWLTQGFGLTQLNGIRNLSGLFRALSTALLLTGLCFAADAGNHFVAVQRSTVRLALPPTLQQVQGSGICINTSCSVVATAYHVQRLVGKANLGVAGGRTYK